MIKTPHGYIRFNYGNIHFKVKDEPKGTFGQGATTARLKIAKQLNELGDMLAIEFPRSLEITIRATINDGTVFRIDNYPALKQRRNMFNVIISMMSYNIVREDVNHIYVKHRL